MAALKSKGILRDPWQSKNFFKPWPDHLIIPAQSPVLTIFKYSRNDSWFGSFSGCLYCFSPIGKSGWDRNCPICSVQMLRRCGGPLFYLATKKNSGVPQETQAWVLWGPSSAKRCTLLLSGSRPMCRPVQAAVMIVVMFAKSPVDRLWEDVLFFRFYMLALALYASADCDDWISINSKVMSND